MTKILNLIKNNLLFILIIIIFSHLTNLHYNLYSVYLRGYEERMIRAYGDCGKESYGFVKRAYNLTNSNNLEIINAERMLWPNINQLFSKFEADSLITNNFDKKYTVILNLKRINKENIIQLDNIKYNLKDKNIILKDSNCYLLKND
jgi:hypothetical protein